MNATINPPAANGELNGSAKSNELAIDYGITREQIEATKEKYAAIECSDSEGYEACRVAIGECRSMRSAVEKRRVQLKADALEWGRKVDTTAKTLTTLIEEIEEPLKVKKAVVDDEKARIKREKEEAEQRRIQEEIEAKRRAEEQKLAEERAKLEAEKAELDKIKKEMEEAQRIAAENQQREQAIQTAINDIRAIAANCNSSNIAEMRTTLAKLDKLAILPDSFGDRWQEAIATRTDVINIINGNLTRAIQADNERKAKEEEQRKAREAEDARLKAERDKLEAEQKRIDEENRKLREAKEKADREEFERQAKIKAEEAAKRKAEQDEIDRKAREAEAERKRLEEEKRIAELRPDVEKVHAFADALYAVELPVVNSDEAIQVLLQANQDINAIVTALKQFKAQ